VNKRKQERLEAAGFVVTDTEDFLGLTDEEGQMIELRVTIAMAVRRRREENHLTQQQLAERMGSSQSRVARIEIPASGVSLELMLRGLFAAGGGLSDLAPALRRTGAGSRAVAASGAAECPA
jgi:predicted XRE-type DNA-binding protein